MKIIKKFIQIITILFITTLPVYPNNFISTLMSYSENKIVNGDMELDSSWSTYHSPSVSERSSAQKYDGSYSWHYVSSVLFDGIQQAYALNSDFGVYDVTAYVYSVSGVHRIRVSIVSSGVYYMDTSTTGSWEKINFTAYTMPGDTTLTFQAFSQTVATGEAYIDNVSVKKIN